MSFRVHFRPNARLVGLYLADIGALLRCLSLTGSRYHVAAGVLALPLLVCALPVLVSTICRAPVLVVDERGLRRPFRGVRVTWSEVTRVSRGEEPAGRSTRQVLIIDVAGGRKPIMLRDRYRDATVEQLGEQINYYLGAAARVAESDTVG